MKEAALTAIWLFALYLLFVGQASTPEVVAGIACAILGGAFRFQTRQKAERVLHFRLSWWPKLLWQVGGKLLVDSWRVGGTLLRLIFGRQQDAYELPERFQPERFQSEPFQSGGSTSQEAGRRAVSVLATSMAPDSFVLAVGPDAVLLHRLAGGPQPVSAPCP